MVDEFKTTFTVDKLKVEWDGKYLEILSDAKYVTDTKTGLSIMSGPEVEDIVAENGSKFFSGKRKGTYFVTCKISVSYTIYEESDGPNLYPDYDSVSIIDFKIL